MKPRTLVTAIAPLALLCVVLGVTPCLAIEVDSSLPTCEDDLPPDLRRICERRELRVVRYSGERPPFFHREGGQWVGFDIDLTRDIAARLGVLYHEDRSAKSFDAVVDQVASGSADIGLSKLSATLDRAQRVRFTNPYLTVYQALLMNRSAAAQGDDPFVTLNSAENTIGALAGSSYIGYARGSFRAAIIQPYDDFSTMMDDVATGKIHAALMDSARANSWRRENREQLIQVRTRIDKRRKDQLAIALAWQDTHLLAWLNLYLEQIKADGTADALYRKWFAEFQSSDSLETSEDNR